MAKPLIFGYIQKFHEGDWFKGRTKMMKTKFHRNWDRGIDGNGTEGVSAIALLRGYEDDFSLVDEIVYAGAGGNDPNTNNKSKIKLGITAEMQGY